MKKIWLTAWGVFVTMYIVSNWQLSRVSELMDSRWFIDRIVFLMVVVFYFYLFSSEKKEKNVK